MDDNRVALLEAIAVQVALMRDLQKAFIALRQTSKASLPTAESIEAFSMSKQAEAAVDGMIEDLRRKVAPATNRYFAVIVNHVTARNKLQKEIVAFVESCARRVIYGCDVEVFLEDARQKVKDLNEAHGGCEPEEVFFEPSPNGDIDVWFGSFVCLRLYAEKEVSHG